MGMEALRSVGPDALLKAVNRALENPEEQLLIESGGKRSVILNLQGKLHTVSVGQIVDRVGELKTYPHGHETIIKLTGRVALLDMELERKLASKGSLGAKAKRSMDRILRKLGLKTSHLHNLLAIRKEMGPEKEHLFRVIKGKTPHKLKALEHSLDSNKPPTIEMMQNLAEEILHSDFSRETVVSFCHQLEVAHQGQVGHLMMQLDDDVAKEVAALSVPLRKAYVKKAQNREELQERAKSYAKELKALLAERQHFPHHLTETQANALILALEEFAKSGDLSIKVGYSIPDKGKSLSSEESILSLFKAHSNPHFSSGLQAWVNSEEGKGIAAKGEEILGFIRSLA